MLSGAPLPLRPPRSLRRLLRTFLVVPTVAMAHATDAITDIGHGHSTCLPVTLHAPAADCHVSLPQCLFYLGVGTLQVLPYTTWQPYKQEYFPRARRLWPSSWFRSTACTILLRQVKRSAVNCQPTGLHPAAPLLSASGLPRFTSLICCTAPSTSSFSLPVSSY